MRNAEKLPYVQVRSRVGHPKLFPWLSLIYLCFYVSFQHPLSSIIPHTSSTLPILRNTPPSIWHAIKATRKLQNFCWAREVTWWMGTVTMVNIHPCILRLPLDTWTWLSCWCPTVRQLIVGTSCWGLHFNGDRSSLIRGLQCRRYFGTERSFNQVLDAAILDCLTSRSLAQRGVGISRQLLPLPQPSVTKSKMAARYQNAHSHAQNTPALQASEPEKYIISNVVLTSRSHFVSSILWELSLKLLSDFRRAQSRVVLPTYKIIFKSKETWQQFRHETCIKRTNLKHSLVFALYRLSALNRF